MIRRLILTATTVLLFAQAAAGGTLDEIRARGVLIVSVKNQGADDAEKHRDPAHFQKRGLEVGIARAIAQKVLGSPDKLDLRMMRKPLRLDAVAAGEVDLGISMLRVTPEAQAKVDFSTPYYRSGLAVLQPRGGPVRDRQSLPGKTFAVINRHDADVDALLAALSAEGLAPRTITVDNFREAMAAMEDGRVAGLISEAVNIDVYLARHGGNLERSPLITEDVRAVATAKGNDGLRQVVNDVLAELESSGALASMASSAELPVGGLTKP